MTMEDEDQAKTNIGGYNGRKGGFRACMFVFVLMFLENMGFVANMVSLVLYFKNVMNFNLADAANTLTNFMGSTFLLSIVGGFISDTYLTRLQTALVFGSIEIMGLVLLTIQAHEKNLHPKKESCVEGGIAMMFYTSLSLLALGSGGVRGSLAPLGADQFDQKNPKEAKALASFFNYMLLSITLGAVIGVTGIVYVSTVKSWFWGFFISTVTASLGFVVLAIGKPFYRIQPLSQSPLIRIAQVIAVAFKNRKISMPENPEELYKINEKDRVSTEEKISHTNQFRWLDRAAIVSKDTEPEEGKICTVTQVEEVKILTRMLPILGSTVIMNTCMAQLQTLSIQQGYVMDPKLGSIKVPAPSIPVIPLAFMSILVPLYEMFFVPFARKITKHPSGITQLQRVGVGLVLSAISMAVAGFIEVKRRNQSNKNILKPISLFWLSFQYGIFGIADMFTLVGLLEFFYKEAPLGMRSLSTSFTWLTLSFGYFLSSAFVSIINSVTKRVAPSKQGWLHGLDINKNNVNLFYWFLAIISVLNFFVYLYSANWYKYKPENIPDDIAAASKSSYSEQPKSVILESKEEKVQESTTEDQKTT
ncbi:hypothetical protein LWI28_007409 [Acer negundo]|uniref:Uncharacterized protein n=1 Tax=Acer negundo TaxID=4023 RepID=A0AAD5NGX2_ACENE|nr:hypothetical protein LWI28_007409 [Acer negundo]KAK4836311.1 hypothetical protein QYF36_021213 [Acer negundo]